MNSLLESPRNRYTHPADDLKCDRAAVLGELDNVLSSQHFRSASRSREFLRYVVLNKLNGQADRLKERTIGTDVFKRPPGYATGEDSVVRVQAGEVRRRLDQYYQEMAESPSVRIELPVGSYCPVFHSGSAAKAHQTAAQSATPARQRAFIDKTIVRLALFLLFVMLVAFAGRSVLKSFHHVDNSQGTFDQFWGPATASHQPVLICVANVSKNAPETAVSSSDLSAASQGKQETPAPPSAAGQDDPEIVPAGDASVAAALSGLFGKLDRPSQLRIGASVTYEDLRSFPAIIIGGFNNKWTMQLLSNLRFAFIRDRGEYMIREQIPGGRVWTTRRGPDGETGEDFAIVSRLIDSKTGQFTVTVAGIGPRGTQAAGEFVASRHDLDEGLAKAPSDWPNRNLQIVLHTTVTESVAGPPQVIATYSW
jgi:hypothetical protein